MAKFVNELTGTAQVYGQTQMLREQMRKVVLQYVDITDPEFECYKCHTKDIDEHQRFCPHCGACQS